jgi:hypothetical protein
MRGREEKQEQIMEAQGFLTYRRVAELTGVTAIAVGRWALTGKLASIAVGHRRYIEKQSLVAYLGKESAAALGLVVPAKAKRPAKAKAKAGRES